HALARRHHPDRRAVSDRRLGRPGDRGPSPSVGHGRQGTRERELEESRLKEGRAMKRIMDGVASFRRFVLTTAGKLQWLPPTLTHICVGWLFMQTGWGKLHHLPDIVDYFKELGIPRP